jgi:signal transduction histidine kinase
VSTLVTLLVGGYLTRRSLERESTRSLARQIDLIAAQRAEKGIAQRGAPDLGDFLATEQERLAILAPEQADLLLPQTAVDSIRQRRVATGTLELHGTRYLYAAQRNGAETLVLLRSARKQSADWTPFVTGLGIAAGISAALAAIVAFALARAIARPITRVADASRELAAGRSPEPLAVQGADEVAALAASFNHLASELDRAQDAERAFLLSVSHELKTPLTAIRGHAEALQDGVLDEQQAGDVIEREAGRLERLIRDLLDLARLRRRSFSVNRATVDLGEVASEVAARFQPLARRFQVSLTAVAEPSASATGDPDRVLQAVSNLVENALRYTAAGGGVRVLASPGRIDIVDDGPGLAEEDLERAFERFYLYDRYGADRPVGTGLGLAIVRELAEAMGGSVEVRSVTGVGSTFSLTLPAAPHAPDAEPGLADPRRVGSGDEAPRS